MSISPKTQFGSWQTAPRVQAAEVPAAIPAAPRIVLPSSRLSKYLDAVFRYSLWICSLSVLAVLGLFFYELTTRSKLSIARFGLHFFVGNTWDPVSGDFGALPFIYGTLVSSLVALVLAVPMAVGVAVFVTELCPRYLRGTISFTVELLAAIPSVIYGLWGIFVLVPILHHSVQPWLAHYLGWTGLVRGATVWDRHAGRGDHSGDHDRSDYCLDHARGSGGGAAEPARGSAGAGGDALGDGSDGRVYAMRGRASWVELFWAWAAQWARRWR